MITDIFLNLIYFFVFAISSPLRLFSDVSLPTDLINTFSTLGGYMYSINAYFPLTVLLSVVALVIGIETAVFTYKVIMWIIKRLPTQS